MYVKQSGKKNIQLSLSGLAKHIKNKKLLQQKRHTHFEFEIQKIIILLEIYCHNGLKFIMALPVMDFQDQGYKIRKVLHKNKHAQWKLLNFENWTNGEPQ